MEQCAYIAASRVGRGGHLLTGSMDGIAFTQPTRVGDVMYITAQVCPAAQPTLVEPCTRSPAPGAPVLPYFGDVSDKVYTGTSDMSDKVVDISRDTSDKVLAVPMT